MTRLPLLVLAAAALLLAQPAQALSPQEQKRLDAQMLKLAPETRAEQRCNRRASSRVRHEHGGFQPDRVVAYAFGDVTVRGTQVEAPGAALRSNGEWYRIAYHCRTTADGLGIEAFDYTLGDKVPHGDWKDHDLYR